MRAIGGKSALWILLAGVALTTLFAFQQRQSQVAHTEFLFDSRADLLEQSVVEGLERRGDELESAISFIAATHPSSETAYRDYFLQEVGVAVELDPGVIFVELVDATGISALEDREKALGNTDFRVVGIPTPSEERLIITRTTQDVEVLGFSLQGLDITGMQRLMLPPNLPENGFVISILESEAMVDFISAPPMSSDERIVDGASLAGVVLDEDGSVLGYSIRFVGAPELFPSVDEFASESLSVRVFVDGITTPVHEVGSAASDLLSSPYATIRSAETATLGWKLEIWADETYGENLGLFDQTRAWLVGALATAIVLVIYFFRSHHHHRISETVFELEHARTLASTDALTGLMNRQGFVDSARSVPNDQPAALFFIDLDGFKTVNDMDGHEAGDRVLREVASRLRTIFRPEDFVGRLGGDEFVIFTPGSADAETHAVISRRITSRLADVDPRVTSSVGVASRIRGTPLDVKELLRSADRAMYEAKRKGGDRFVLQTDEIDL